MIYIYVRREFAEDRKSSASDIPLGYGSFVAAEWHSGIITIFENLAQYFPEVFPLLK